MTTIEEEIQNLKKFLVNYPTIQLIEYLERIIDDRENAFIPTLAKGLEWKDFSLNENDQLLKDLKRNAQVFIGDFFLLLIGIENQFLMILGKKNQLSKSF